MKLNPKHSSWKVKPVSSYEGEGALYLGADDGKECNFSCFQWANGRILLLCEVKEPATMEDFKDFFGGKEEEAEDKTEIHFEGTTQEGKCFEATPGSLLNREFSTSGKNQYLFRTNNCMAKAPDKDLDSANKMQFMLTNVLFLPPTIELELDENYITLEKTENYKSKKGSLKKWKFPEITAKANIQLEDWNSISEAKESIDKLCTLLTLANNTMVSRISHEFQTEDFAQVKIRHNSRVVKDYTPIRFIPKDKLECFVKTTYPNFELADNGINLFKAVSSFTDAKVEEDFLELRALKMVNVLEFVRRSYLEDTDNQYGWSKEYNRLDYVPFKTGLCSLIEDLGLDSEIQQAEIENLRQSRNCLVHEMVFYTRHSWKEYRFLINLVGKLLLGITGYEGEYLDWEKKAKEEFMLEGEISQKIQLDTKARQWPFSI